MKYLVLAYGDPQKMAKLSKSEFEALVERCKLHDAELRKTGKLVSAQSLEWATTSIRPGRNGPVVTDGPFAETKEQVGGQIVIEAADLNEAIRIASMHPAAHLGLEMGWGLELHPMSDECHQ